MCLFIALQSTQESKITAFNQPYESQTSHKLRISLTKGGDQASWWLHGCCVILISVFLRACCTWLQPKAPFMACSNSDSSRSVSEFVSKTGPESTFPQMLFVFWPVFQMGPAVRKTRGVRHSAANRVEGPALFMIWMDLLRKGIPSEAKCTVADGWER